MRIIIPFEPTSQERVRIGRFGGYKKKSQKLKESKIIHHLEQHRQTPLMEGFIRIQVLAYYARQKSHYGTGKNAGVLKIGSPYWCNKRPDYDNLAKQISDCGTGIIWKDDQFIVSGTVNKMYTNNYEPKWVIDVIQI